MSNPWLKFYPSDWRSDPALRMCSIAARGLWMEMLCVMHENNGELSVNGRGLTPRQLATLAGCPDVEDLLSELEDAGVFSRRDDGTIFSRRMIRDAQKAAQDKENGKKGGNPKIKSSDKQGVNPPDKGEDKAQKPEARSQSMDASASKARQRAAFDEWYSHYPHKVQRGAAEKAFPKALSLASLDELIEGVRRYVANKPADRPFQNPATWLNGKGWLDAPAQTQPRASPAGWGKPRGSGHFDDFAEQISGQERTSGSEQGDWVDASSVPILTIEYQR